MHIVLNSHYTYDVCLPRNRLTDDVLQLCSQLLNDEQFKTVDKIKTMGSCYMAAVGLTPDNQIQVTIATF